MFRIAQEHYQERKSDSEHNVDGDTVISENICLCPSGGAGVRNLGVMTIDSSTISDNTASSNAGGIFNEGTLSIDNRTISGNTASAGNAGGIGNFGGGTLDIANSTISGNTAPQGAGGSPQG